MERRAITTRMMERRKMRSKKRLGRKKGMQVIDIRECSRNKIDHLELASID
jgi:hypothetical protein